MQNTHKKICIVSISLGKGGAERSAAMLSEMLHNQGYDVHVAILTDAIAYPFKGTLLNLGTLKTEDEPLQGRFKRLLKLRTYLKNHRIDIVIDHRTKNNLYKEQFYHRFIYKGVKKIYVVHSANPSLYLTRQPKKFGKVYNQNTASVGVSRYISEIVLPKYGITNSVAIPNAYNPNWGMQDGNLPEILKNETYMLSYGRIDDTVKDLTFLLNSYTASTLWKQGIKLVLLGDGPDKEALQQFVMALPSASQIIFLPNQSPFKIISNAKFVTLTSRFEGFPMVLVEALSLGIPVISLAIVSGPSEIIQNRENGLLIAKRDVSLFAEAMQEMIANEHLYEQCRKNAKASVSQFSMVEISKKWNKLLQDAVR